MSSLTMLRVVFVIIISIVLVRNVDVALAYSGVFTEWGVGHGADDLLMTGEPAPASEAATARVMSLIQTRTSEMGEASAAPRTSSYAALATEPFRPEHSSNSSECAALVGPGATAIRYGLAGCLKPLR